MSTDTVVEVTDLHKHYGDNRAVDGVSFEIRRGEVYALLGENGAGKTSIVETLEGFRTATSGRLHVLGMDPSAGGRELRDRIGIVLQTSGIENQFTVREVVELYGSCYRTRRPTDEVIELVGLAEKADDRVGSLSGGQRRRIDLAIGIIGTPDLLFLDEPTTGFDPAARRRSWDLIESLCAGGTTVLLTTHYLDEAEHLADRVGVLSRGRMVAEDSPQALVEATSGTTVSFMLPEHIDVADASSILGPVLEGDVRISGRLVETTIDRPTAAVHRLTAWAVEAQIELEALSVSRASLEDVYLALAEETAEVAGHRPTGDAG